MATDLEFREAVATAEKLSSLISKSTIGEFLTDNEHKEYEYCKKIVNAFVTAPSVEQRLPAFKKALEQGISVRCFSTESITGEKSTISISRGPNGIGYQFAILVNSDLFETEESCLEAAVTYLKEL